MSSLEARSAALLGGATPVATSTAITDGPITPSMSAAETLAYVAAIVVGVPLGLVFGLIVVLMLGFGGAGMVC